MPPTYPLWAKIAVAAGVVLIVVAIAGLRAARPRNPTFTTLLIVLALGAVACTSRGWTKAGTAEADFNRDSYACARETSSDSFAWRAPIAGGPRFGPKVDKDLYRACMRARGYQFVEGGQWQGLRD